MTTQDKSINEKAQRLYQYLLHLVRLRTSVTYDAEEYIDVILFNNIPHHQLCHCAAWDIIGDEDDSTWLEIKRPILPKVPLVPEECKKWVNLSTLEDYKKEPSLKEKIAKDDSLEEGNIEYLLLSDFPTVQEVWRDYIDKKWKPWAQEYSSIKEVQEIYSHLFNMYQQQKALGESYEVVIGLGLLSYKTKEGIQIYRHILSAQTELVFEPEKGTITVKASPEGAKLRFETEMLDPSQQPPVEILLNLEERLKEISDEIWDKSLLQPIIKSWINSMDPKSVYDESIVPIPKNAGVDYPIASFAPAIILRKRTNIGILRFIDKIIEQLQQTKEVPESVRILTIIDEKSKKDEFISSEEEINKKAAALPEEIYFPLHYNDEQFKIVREIKDKKGVLVQGPPGTGKSHTIANLICHFLTSGKKVLITSQTARALKVLKEKIPKQIQPLCVSILGHREEDFNNLESAVNEITSKYYSWDGEKNREKVNRLESELASLKKIFQEITVTLRELREKETYKHSIIEGKFNGTAQDIAQQLKETENRFGWIPDEIKSDLTTPLSNQQFNRLLELYRKFNEQKYKELALKRMRSSEIFTPQEFVEIVENEQKYKEKEHQIESDIRLKLLYEKLKKADKEKRDNLLTSLRILEKAKAEARRRPLPWLKDSVWAILGEQDQPLRDLFEFTKKYLQGQKEKASLADDCNIIIPVELSIHKIKADAEDLLSFLEKGRKLGWSIFRPPIYKKVKYILKNIFVNGRNCNSVDCLKLLINFIDVKITIEKLKEAWKSKIEVSSGTNFSQISFLSEQQEALEVILAIEKPLAEAKKSVKEIDVISEPPWHDDSEIESLITVLEGTLVIDKMYAIHERMDKIKVILKATIASPESHQINQDLLNALESRDWKKWGELYNALIGLEEEKKNLEECTGLMEKLREKAPLLAEFICDNPYEEALQECSNSFEEAWDWLRADAWLREFEEKHDEYRLQREYADYEKKFKNIMSELVSEKAWGYCFSNMTEEQRQNLVAWSHAIQKIGKGKGKRAEKYRREAEGYMNNCRSAIPAWIMPLYRVAETISPKPEIFDVVIVDEASQCGPEALFLLYIAKKCIVVGDDQQISPESVGIERNEVDLLIERFLKDIPLRETYGLESSLFTHAAIRYGSRIFLQEHFRCVPEIIEFSNDLCYTPLGASLIPLRSYPPKRLEPIRRVYVQGGYREGYGQNVINKPEAEALVAQIWKCCKDPIYKNKTMGVISLQGDTQARHIQRLLIDKIGPEEMENRNLICGDAYDFQGDERDVIFLSLVAATNERIGPLVKDTDKRRFNVAFSRARDQIWLFHSVTLNDLSQSDYRYKLLSYCQNPFFPYSVVGEINLEEIRKLAKDKKFKVTPPEPFESWFEVDVFMKIVEHGYKVLPQFKVAEKRIDMVIEGLNNRLAIECDGDTWHGPEQYERDQFRQRILERANWKFWRIRGSTFYHDPEHALDTLWQILEEMEIESKEQASRDKEIEAMEEKIVQKEAQPSVSQKEDRLAAILEYDKKMSEERLKKLKYEDIKQNVLDILREGTQGKDLIAEKVLRKMGITCRGRNRAKLRNKILRVITDLRRVGIIEEYETDARKRIRLLRNQEETLFS